MHSHRIPRLPLNESMSRWHKIQGSNFFSQTVYLCFRRIRNFKFCCDIHVDFSQILIRIYRIFHSVVLGHIPNSFDNFSSTSSVEYTFPSFMESTPF